MNNFNFVAPIYDQLAWIVFGNKLRKAEVHFLYKIEPQNSVLIIGGGTGKLLEKLPECQRLTFLEKSKRMMERAMKRKTNHNIDFVQEDFFDMTSDRYDIIVTPFFLDCFAPANLKSAIVGIKSKLNTKGKFLVTEFVPGKRSILMTMMHRFFGVFSNLESKSLKNIHQFIIEEGFVTEKEEFFHEKMIFSRVYRNL